METVEGNEPKREEFSRKELEMSKGMSDNHPSTPALAENPNAIIRFPSEVVLIR